MTKQEQTKLAEDKKTKPKDQAPAKKPPREHDGKQPRPEPRTERPTVAVPQEPTTAPQPSIDSAGAGAGEADTGNDDGAKSMKKRDADEEAPTQAAPPPAAGSVAAADYDGDVYEAESLSLTSSRYKSRRLSLSLGGGLTVVNGDAAPQLGLALRFDWGRETRVGGEASVWLVDGLHGQGSALATVAQRITRRLELGIGAGLRFTGDTAGPALNLTLRSHLPIRGLSTFLRYDGALLLRNDTYDGQNAGSFGFEASF